LAAVIVQGSHDCPSALVADLDEFIIFVPNPSLATTFISENVDSASQEKLLLVGAKSAPSRDFRVSKSSAFMGLTPI